MRKRMLKGICLTAIVSSAMMQAVSCRWGMDSGSGRLGISISEMGYTSIRESLESSGGSVPTRASEDIPDTNSFILTVTDSRGNSIYDGPYGESPQELELAAGSYTVKAVSGPFPGYGYSTPQFGDEQVVLVPAGRRTAVCLECRQQNCGIGLRIAPEFLTAYPGAALFVCSSDGKLMYSYSERRYAYFRPGEVSVMMSDGGRDQTLLTRILGTGDMLTINLSVSEGHGSTISMDVDTSRNWSSENFTIGESDKGNMISNALTIQQAKCSIGSHGVWIRGFIVGGDLTSSAKGISFTPPFLSNTNIAIAPRTNVFEKQSCMSVQLSTKAIRESLNLADHPELLRRDIYIKGDIVEAYYGLPGIKNITEFQFGEQPDR